MARNSAAPAASSSLTVTWLASQGRLDPGVALVEKPFSEADLLATAGQILNGHFPGCTTTQETRA